MAHIVTVGKSPSFPLHVEAWRNLVRIVRPRVATRQLGGGMRGEIHGFSRQARRRLILQLARANNDPAYFVTFTYGRNFPTLRDSKEDLRVVLQRLLRLTARSGCKTAVLWRAETQKRGAVHYHCLIWAPGRPARTLVDHLPPDSRRGVWAHVASLGGKVKRKGRIRPGSRLDWLLALSAIWEERLRGNNRGGRTVRLRSVDVRRVHSRAEVVGYVSKYLAKVEAPRSDPGEPSGLANTGRLWGVRGEREVIDEHSLARLSEERTATTDRELGHAWHDTGLLWAEAAEEDGILSYYVFLPPEAFWRVLDRLLQMVCRREVQENVQVGEKSPDLEQRE